jgi:LysM repeat protein
MERAVKAALAGTLILVSASSADAQSLRGSPATMQQQHRVALQHDYTFIQTSAQLRRFVDAGLLVSVPGNANYTLARVSHPYARPAIKLFIERLSAQYRSACGEKLVVTSLTRPVREQPRNASHLSVHPAGMAVDLRISNSAACRRWLESTLLSLEKQGVLNAIRENRPPHYHVALYPTSYTRYVAQVTNARGTAQLASALDGSAGKANTKGKATGQAATVAAATEQAADESTAVADEAAILVAANSPATGPNDADAGSGRSEDVLQYRVNRGDSLWSIARRHNTTVDTLKQLNGLRSTSIMAGQTLSIPSVTTGAEDSQP